MIVKPTKHMNSLVPQVDLSSLTDNELLVLFVDREMESAFEELVSRHHQMVFNVCRAVTWDHCSAEDAFQATFLAALRNARRLRRAVSFSGWLCRVARNAAIKAAKRNRTHECQFDFDDTGIEIDPLKQIAAREVIQSLAEELEAIPKRYREALTLFYFEQLSRAQIANRMGSTEIAIKSLLQRGRRLLRQRMMRNGVIPSMVVLGISAASNVSEASTSSALISKTVAVCAGKTTAPQSAVFLSGSGSWSIATCTNAAANAMLAACLILGMSMSAVWLTDGASKGPENIEISLLGEAELPDYEIPIEFSSPIPSQKLSAALEMRRDKNQGNSATPDKKKAQRIPQESLPVSIIQSRIVSPSVANVEKLLRTDHRIDTITSSTVNDLLH